MFMTPDHFKFLLKEALKSVKAEIRYKRPGHMGTTKFALVLSMDGEEVFRMPLGDDGFNDGDPLGWTWDAVEEK